MNFDTLRDRIQRSLDSELDSLDDPEIAGLMRERTARFAEAPRESSRELLAQVVEVRRGDGRLGLPRARVKEIRSVRLCRLPHMPRTLPGVFHLRGRVLPALDLQPLLGEFTSYEQGARCTVAVLSDPRGNLGLCIDEVRGLRLVYADEIDGNAELGRNDFITAVTRDLLALIDVDKLLAHDEFSLSPTAP